MDIVLKIVFHMWAIVLNEKAIQNISIAPYKFNKNVLFNIVLWMYSNSSSITLYVRWEQEDERNGIKWGGDETEAEQHFVKIVSWAQKQ